MTNNSLLAGVRVLDLSRLLPGPFCSLYLAQLGAEVIKIEEPEVGDYARSLAPEVFGLANRGKKSVVLDLKDATAREQFKALVQDTDVVLESFRPGVMDRLGVGWDVLKAINPKLVYCSISGYGWTGPWKNLAGHDLNYLGIAGVMDQMGTVGGPPTQAGIPFADIAGGGLTACIGILSAILGVQKSGVGCFVDVSMTDSALAMQTATLAALRAQGTVPPRGDDLLTGALPNYRLYKCRDGKYFALGSLEPKFFKAVLKGLWETSPDMLHTALSPVLKIASLAQGERGERSSDGGGSKKPDPVAQLTRLLEDRRKSRLVLAPLHLALSAVFRLRTRDEWTRLLAPYDACATPILDLSEALEHEQIVARGLVENFEGKPAIRNPIRFVGATTSSGPAPALGEHTDAVLGAARTRSATAKKKATPAKGRAKSRTAPRGDRG